MERRKAELDMLMERAGVPVPPDRQATLLAAFVAMRAELALLHAMHDSALEPASVFRLDPLGGV